MSGASDAVSTSGAKPGRLVAVDLLRGYFILAVIIDHLGRFPGLYDVFTGRGWLWVSAAEGFFLLSGMMIGLVRGRQLRQDGFRPVLIKIWRRAAKLYVWTVLLTLLFTFWALAVGGHGVKPGWCDPRGGWTWLWQAVRLSYVYGWTDFLAYYVLFLVAAPAALWLTARRRWWWVVPLAALVAWRLGSHHDLAFSWQLPFFLGITTGYYLRDLEAAARRLPRIWQRGLTWGAVSATAATIALSYALCFSQNYGHNLLAGVPGVGAWFGRLLRFYALHLAGRFSRAPIGVGRLAMFALWFGAAYYLTRRYEASLARWLGWLLLPLGQYPLHAFILQGLAVFAAGVIVAPTTSLWVNFIIVTVVLGIIWLVTKRKWLFWLIPT